MEASQKPPSLFEGGTVRVLGDRVVVEHLEIDDARVADTVRQRAEVDQTPVQTVTNAIEIGARVLEREGMAAEVDYVQREFERTAGHVREQFTEQARGLTDAMQKEMERAFAEDGGVLGKTLDSHAGEIAEQITKHFSDDSSGAVQHRVKDMVEKSLRDQRESLVKHLSSDGDSNPLAEFKRQVQTTLLETVRTLRQEEVATREKLVALHTEVVKLTEQTDAGKALAEAEAAGTRKGFTFEERVHEAIEAIANTRGDAASHTGMTGADGGGKKGDTVVELGGADGPSCGRIVFEAKDRKSQSKNDVWKELNASREARAAGFAVMVIAGEDRMPAKVQPLTEYEGNKMIVAVDRENPDGLVLEVAYRLAAARVSMVREGNLDVDPVAVRDETDAALANLKQAQSIRGTLTSIKNGADRAYAQVDALVDDVRARLVAIESLVAEAAESEDEAAGETPA